MALKIGLIFPNKSRKDKTLHTGLGYIASYARGVHPEVEFSLLDTRVARRNETTGFFQSDLDIIGITVLSPVYHEVIEVFKFIRSNKPATLICLGGPYVTTLMEDIFLETPADFAVYGEGEITFAELIGYLKGDVLLENIQGLMYQVGDKITKNPPRQQIQDLDSLPYPAYDLFKMDRYPMHRIVTSRGCPYKCVFCNSSSIWSATWRKRAPEKVVEEMEYVTRLYNKKVFFLNDNSFNIDLHRVRTFCRILIDRNLRVLWSTPVRVEIITQETALLMKKAGCYNVGIGIESANSTILERMKKKNSIEDVKKGIRIFKDAGIEVLGQFVIGSPGDTLETVKESIAFAKNAGLDFVMFYAILPFKNTEQWEYVQKEGTLYNIKTHDYHSTHPRIVFETPEFTYADRLKAIEMATNEGYYSDSNDKSLFFDLGKFLASRLISWFPPWFSHPLYLGMKNLYRKRILKSR